jgi:ubiquinone/menaquinone biosynthesis C-methylase UbiE
MVLYDFLAPAYDPFLKPIYTPFRKRALAFLKIAPGSTVLDLACGTGQNFPYLDALIKEKGTLIGIDISSGMLRRAQRAADRMINSRVTLLQADATQMSPSWFTDQTGLAQVDAVVCTYGFTAMPNWEEAFRRSLALLKPGGTYFIHDIYAERRGLHVSAFEFATRVDLARKSWLPLQELCPDFKFEYIDPSAHIFAGRLFVAMGIKPQL